MDRETRDTLSTIYSVEQLGNQAKHQTRTHNLPLYSFPRSPKCIVIRHISMPDEQKRTAPQKKTFTLHPIYVKCNQ